MLTILIQNSLKGNLNICDVQRALRSLHCLDIHSNHFEKKGTIMQQTSEIDDKIF